jgi:membrane associated rhomboid family serine protease
MIKMGYDRSSNLFVPQSTVVLLMIWLVFCMTPIATQMGMNVANWAHAIGLFVGMTVAYLPVILKGPK